MPQKNSVLIYENWTLIEILVLNDFQFRTKFNLISQLLKVQDFSSIFKFSRLFSALTVQTVVEASR